MIVVDRMHVVRRIALRIHRFGIDNDVVVIIINIVVVDKCWRRLHRHNTRTNLIISLRLQKMKL